MDVINSLVNSTICMTEATSGSLRLLETGLEMVTSLGDLYVICKTETISDLPQAP